MFSRTVALCLAFSKQVTCYVLADCFICSNTCSFVSAVNSCNDTVSLLGPMFCIACYDSCLAAVVHGLGYTWITH
jgi:hypothetical protein